MVRFLGQGGPKVCEILHLPQLKQSNTYFFGKKEDKKRNLKPEGETPALVAFESYKTGILTSLYSSGSSDHVLADARIRIGCVSLRRGGQRGCKASQVRANIRKLRWYIYVG